MEVRNALGIAIIRRNEIKRAPVKRRKYNTTNRPRKPKPEPMPKEPITPKSKVITVRLEPELYERLLSAAKIIDKPPVEVVRRAIMEYL
jgi:hypothetical protein